MSFSTSFFILFPPSFYCLSLLPLSYTHAPFSAVGTVGTPCMSQNHSEMIMKLVSEAVCLVSEAHPAQGMWIRARCSGTGAPSLAAAVWVPSPTAQAAGRGEDTVLEQLAGNVSGLFGGRRDRSALRAEGWGCRGTPVTTNPGRLRVMTGPPLSCEPQSSHCPPASPAAPRVCRPLRAKRCFFETRGGGSEEGPAHPSTTLRELRALSSQQPGTATASCLITGGCSMHLSNHLLNCELRLVILPSRGS